MLRPWFQTSRILVVVPLILALAVAVACGSTTTAEPETIVREVTKQVEVVTETEITKVVPVEVTQEEVKLVVATPLPTSEALSMEVVKGQSFNFPVKPAWVRKGKQTDRCWRLAPETTPAPGTPTSPATFSRPLYQPLPNSVN